MRSFMSAISPYNISRSKIQSRGKNADDKGMEEKERFATRVTSIHI